MQNIRIFYLKILFFGGKILSIFEHACFRNGIWRYPGNATVTKCRLLEASEEWKIRNKEWQKKRDIWNHRCTNKETIDAKTNKNCNIGTTLEQLRSNCTCWSAFVDFFIEIVFRKKKKQTNKQKHTLVYLARLTLHYKSIMKASSNIFSRCDSIFAFTFQRNKTCHFLLLERQTKTVADIILFFFFILETIGVDILCESVSSLIFFKTHFSKWCLLQLWLSLEGVTLKSSYKLQQTVFYAGGQEFNLWISICFKFICLHSSTIRLYNAIFDLSLLFRWLFCYNRLRIDKADELKM